MLAGDLRSITLGREDPLEKEMATHFSILDWRIPWTEEPGGLQPMGSQRVGHDRETNTHTDMHAWISLANYTLKSHFYLLTIRIQGNGTPLQYSCLEIPMDRGAWRAAVHGVAKSRTWLNDFTFTFYFNALNKEMATHSSVLAWRIPGMGAPGGLPSLGLHRVRHDWSDLAAAAAEYNDAIDIFIYTHLCNTTAFCYYFFRFWLQIP